MMSKDIATNFRDRGSENSRPAMDENRIIYIGIKESTLKGDSLRDISESMFE